MTDEEKKEYNRLRSHKWKSGHREQCREDQRNYRLEHPEECAARNKKWNEENPELVAGYKKKYSDNNPGANNQSSANWRKNHPEHKRTLTRQRRAKLKEAGGTITTEEWLSVLQLYGPACLCCGEVKPLTMDHVVPIFCGGTHTVDNVQPLCLSCNSSKGTQTIDYRERIAA
jgi:5-methylcytosine-specific restriction endonuclease McrA